MVDDRWRKPGSDDPGFTEAEAALRDRIAETFDGMYLAHRLLRGRLTDHGAAYLATVAVDVMRRQS